MTSSPAWTGLAPVPSIAASIGQGAAAVQASPAAVVRVQSSLVE
jgi:hypothetical protein